MAVAAAVPVFAVALVATLGAATTFARRLDRLGAKHGLPEVWIGLLTALAADGPEISSALIALIKGAPEAGVGVIAGSNMFNLAAMIGVSVLLAGCVQLSRRTLALDGAVALAVTGIVIALLVGWVPTGVALAVIAGVVVPYLVLVVGGYELACRLGMRRIAGFVLGREAAATATPIDPRHREFATHRQLALMVVDLVVIVAGSYGMVQAALSLGAHWRLGSAVVGALILGPLTSLPNALTGIRLGLAGRGAALVTEALNSNTINLIAGVALPSLFVAVLARTASDRLGLVLLAAATAATVALLAARGGMRRGGAAIIVALYGAFIAVTLS